MKRFERIDAWLLTNCIRNYLNFLDAFYMFSVSVSDTEKNLCNVDARDTVHGKHDRRCTHVFGVLEPRRRQLSQSYCHRGWNRLYPESLEWHCPLRSLSKPMTIKQIFSTQNTLVTVSGGPVRHPSCWVQAARNNHQLTVAVLCCATIQTRRLASLSIGVMLLHDNARPHAAARTQAFLQWFGLELLSRFGSKWFSLLHKTEGSWCKSFKSNKYMTPAVKEWLNGLNAVVCGGGIQAFVTLWRDTTQNSSHAMTSGWMLMAAM